MGVTWHSEAEVISLEPQKFILYNLAGIPKAYYSVTQKPLTQKQDTSGKASIAHSIIIIDRSGSMYSDIEALKDNLIKLLTLDEYIQSKLLITLISYSSKGDVICHFQRVPILEVMKPDSSYLQEIHKIRVTGCTCISQSLQIAKTLLQEHTEKNNSGELTAITLHTDGYANDPSYNWEIRQLDAICEELKTLNVFVNTISYSYADYQLLAKIANSLSGTCLQVGDIKTLYNALYQTTQLLTGSLIPPIEEPLETGEDYQVFVSKSAKKINAAAGTIKIMGLKPEDDAIVYKYRQVTAEEYDQLSVDIKQTDESVFAFIKGNLADGNLNTAKYALVSTFDQTLVAKHAKALTNIDICKLTQDIEEVVFNPAILSQHQITTEVQTSDKITILELTELLEQNKERIIINLKHLEENYHRRGVKRIPGHRDKNGQLIEAWLKTEPLDNGEYLQMGTFSINHNTATINLLLSRQVKLVTIEEPQTQITEVAGILVNNLESYKDYQGNRTLFCIIGNRQK